MELTIKLWILSILLLVKERMCNRREEKVMCCRCILYTRYQQYEPCPLSSRIHTVHRALVEQRLKTLHYQSVGLVKSSRSLLVDGTTLDLSRPFLSTESLTE